MRSTNLWNVSGMHSKERAALFALGEGRLPVVTVRPSDEGTSAGQSLARAQAGVLAPDRRQTVGVVRGTDEVLGTSSLHVRHVVLQEAVDHHYPVHFRGVSIALAGFVRARPFGWRADVDSSGGAAVRSESRGALARAHARARTDARVGLSRTKGNRRRAP